MSPALFLFWDGTLDIAAMARVVTPSDDLVSDSLLLLSKSPSLRGAVGQGPAVAVCPVAPNRLLHLCTAIASYREEESGN